MSTAWKNLELRIAKTLGGKRNGPNPGSDVTDTPFSVECKRTTRYCLRRIWIEQARRQSKVDGKPWLLVVSEHHDSRPLAVMDFYQLTEIFQQAGLIPELKIEEAT